MSECRGPVDPDSEIPRIYVRCIGDSEPEWIEHLEYGIEEEGVSWLVQAGADGDSIPVAYRSALDSSLKIGVSVSSDSRIVIHHKQLPENDPMFDVRDITPDLARKLGSNSARLAKGTPLKMIS